MPLLAIDASLSPASLALLLPEGEIAASRLAKPRSEAEELVPAIAALTRRAGTDLSEFKRIAVSTGPGPFMSLRAGLAAAKGLALALETPLFAFSTMEILAAHHQARPLLIALEAPQETFALQLFSEKSGVSPLLRAGADEISAKLPIGEEESLFVAGSGAAAAAGGAGGSSLSRRDQILPLPDNLASVLARLAASADESQSDRDALPIYLQPPTDARPAPPPPPPAPNFG